VVCYDISENNLSKFKKRATISLNSLDVFKNSDVIFLSLPSSKEVKEVTDKFLESKCKNKTIIDLSTSYPFITQNIYKEFKAQHLEFSDASISGTPNQAKNGEITLLFGGDKDTYDNNLNIMSSFSKKVHYMGSSGSGNIAKLINNYLAVMYDVLYAEIFPFAEYLGMDTSYSFKVIGESGVDSRLYRTAGKQIVEKNFNLNFSLDLALKDLNYVKNMHEEMDVPSHVLDGAINLLTLGTTDGTNTKDITEIANTVEYFYKGG